MYIFLPITTPFITSTTIAITAATTAFIMFVVSFPSPVFVLNYLW
jgi:hypothetical protein